MIRVGAAFLAVVVVGVGVAVLLGGRPGPQRWAPPETGAGELGVELSADVRRDRDGSAVATQLARYFTAINDHDYAAWVATVTQERAASIDEQAWLAGYASTTDGTVRIERIDRGAAGTLLVRLRFVSTQEVGDAPPGVPVGRICWRSTLPMTGSPPLVDVTGAGSAIATAC